MGGQSILITTQEQAGKGFGMDSDGGNWSELIGRSWQANMLLHSEKLTDR